MNAERFSRQASDVFGQFLQFLIERLGGSLFRHFGGVSERDGHIRRIGVPGGQRIAFDGVRHLIQSRPVFRRQRGLDLGKLFLDRLGIFGVNVLDDVLVSELLHQIIFTALFHLIFPDYAWSSTAM